MLSRFSLRTRIAFLVVGSVVPLACVGLAASWFLYRTYAESNSVRLVSLARTLLNSTEARLASVIGAAEALALSPLLQSDNFDGFRTVAEKYLEKHLPTSTIVVTDREGVQRVNTGAPSGAALPSVIATPEIKAIHEAMLTDPKPRVSGVFVGPVLKEPRISTHVPVIREEKFVFVIGISIAPSLLSDVLGKANLPADWTVAIFDQSGATVARYPARDIGQPASPSLQPALKERRDQLLETTTHEGTVVSTAVAYSPQTGWSVALGVPSRSIETPFQMAIVGIFGIGAASVLVGLFAALRLARSVLIADHHRELLVNELNHRVKNTLATIQALASQSMRHAASKEDGARALESRILTLSRAHDLLTDQHWEAASARSIIENATGAYAGRKDAIVLSGPDASLAPQVALSLAMVLNELATNATKYGALSGEGSVHINWRVAENNLHLTWQEHGGPHVAPPTSRGFGSRLIETGFHRDLKTTLTFASDGVRCEISCSIRAN
jgi:two-component sensor histidine kinase